MQLTLQIFFYLFWFHQLASMAGDEVEKAYTREYVCLRPEAPILATYRRAWVQCKEVCKTYVIAHVLDVSLPAKAGRAWSALIAFDKSSLKNSHRLHMRLCIPLMGMILA